MSTLDTTTNYSNSICSKVVCNDIVTIPDVLVALNNKINYALEAIEGFKLVSHITMLEESKHVDLYTKPLETNDVRI